ncbi:MAG: hypothetical protein J6Z30_08255 [Pyramidobacter sp.]|nr:hypothetical protein [Pyramidobacter sp.]
MHDPLLDHDEISKVQGCPCHIEDDHHGHEHAHGRTRPHHEHTHEYGEHVHDGRPHVHMPDGTVRYLEEGELPSAPKRRRSPAQE